MSTALTFFNLLTLLTASPTTAMTPLPSEESLREFIDVLEAEECDLEIPADLPTATSIGSSSSDLSPSKEITDIATHLATYYPGYTWVKDASNSGTTADVSNAIPIEMKSDDFPQEEIYQGVINAGLADKTNYGGCGPIAALGILDYFARYLGYDEIIADPTDSEQRIALSTEYFENVTFSIFSTEAKGTLVWPWETASAFNEVIANCGLQGVITAKDTWSLFAGEHPQYWRAIVEDIDEGIPVTMFTGKASGEGKFSEHYTNIYGYETWTGINPSTGVRMTKRFVQARLNFRMGSKIYYCDADIFNCGQVGIIRYSVDYANSYSFYASDFANTFVNSSGGGQYFFYDIQQPVTLSNGITLSTNRLRTSYIENKYLVLSPNRANAGTAYLDMEFPHDVTRLTFDAAMWSSLEGAIYEDFVIQYYDNGWVDHIEIDPYRLSASKTSPDSFTVLFPKGSERVRFYATHKYPTITRNKGRICLDNFNVEYN